jgi:hypothetical protein
MLTKEPVTVFYVEHTRDVTKGLLRLYQKYKLRVKMFIISNQKISLKQKLLKCLLKKSKMSSFSKIMMNFEAFFESVKK